MKAVTSQAPHLMVISVKNAGFTLKTVAPYHRVEAFNRL
jgi:hypothetical protein